MERSKELRAMIAKDLRVTRESFLAEAKRLDIDPFRLHGSFAGPGWLEAERGIAADLYDQRPKLVAALEFRRWGTVVLDCGRGIGIYIDGHRKLYRLATAEEISEELGHTALIKSTRLASLEREVAFYPQAKTA